MQKAAMSKKQKRAMKIHFIKMPELPAEMRITGGTYV